MFFFFFNLYHLGLFGSLNQKSNIASSRKFRIIVYSSSSLFVFTLFSFYKAVVIQMLTLPFFTHHNSLIFLISPLFCCLQGEFLTQYSNPLKHSSALSLFCYSTSPGNYFSNYNVFHFCTPHQSLFIIVCHHPCFQYHEGIIMLILLYCFFTSAP